MYILRETCLKGAPYSVNVEKYTIPLGGINVYANI